MWLWVAMAGAAEGDPVGDGFALSVGTGPRPLDTAALGLTGLGGRVMFPVGRVVPWVGIQATRASVANFDDGEREDRFETTMSAVHGSLGARIDLSERKARSVSPYLNFGALAGRAAVSSRDVADDFRFVSGTNTVLGLAGVGVDGFVSKHLSIGGELGLLGGTSSARSKEIERGEVDEDEEIVTTSVFSTFTGLMLTVWR